MSARIESSDHLSDIAVRFPGATRVFHRHGLDFCCNGRISLQEACQANRVDTARVSAELEEVRAQQSTEARVTEAPLAELIQHILDRFHAAHREDVPRLVAMAQKVEEVHAGKPDCPVGLGDHLARMAEELEMHMQKEEQVLFPLILAGRGQMAAMPISIMEEEHQDHGKNLGRMRELARGFVPPEDACTTWRALYVDLAGLERQLMEHIHLENNVVFPRSLQG